LKLREDLQELVHKGRLRWMPAWYLSQLSLNGQAEVLSKLEELRTDEAICRYAQAVAGREKQGSLFGKPKRKPSRKVQERRSVMERAWDGLAPTSLALTTFLELTPAEMAEALGPTSAEYHGVQRTWAGAAYWLCPEHVGVPYPNCQQPAACRGSNGWTCS
jgi:hypothetical protein